ncbi:putative glycosidase CRH2 [Coemansia brasiliensis]|uniref:Glycosidase CRH2 n=1 Tax=Coemansia brasiliensis TaxID=2650707 RepID=A0A9W8LXH9_9FUNG|nr:putative glycosidase CRH2 [Coemansia brasiliensis]
MVCTVLFCILLLSLPYSSRADNGLGVCLRQVFFGQDVYNDPYTPNERIVSKLYSGSHRYNAFYGRDTDGNGLETLVPANDGFINLSDFFNGGNSNENEATSSSSSTKPTPESTSTPTPTSLESTSSSEHESSSSETSSKEENGATGSPSQEPSGKAYTCKSEFIDFSQSDAMSKFSFVWCPQNAIQTDNSVKWVLTQACGTTMVYPWDFKQGRVEARIRIGAGSGVVTALLLLGPPPSDEIDFEWVGKDTTSVQTMYYYQAHRVVAMPLVFTVDQANGQDLSNTFQNYAIELHEDKVEWFFNGKSIRVLQKENKYFPSDATRARMGIWDGTQTSGWAGTVDWSKGQFTAEMQWFNFTPFC